MLSCLVYGHWGDNLKMYLIIPVSEEKKQWSFFVKNQRAISTECLKVKNKYWWIVYEIIVTQVSRGNV